MEVFAPLSNAAAYWLEVDAWLRIFWSAIGAVAVVVLLGATVSGVWWLWTLMTPPKER